MPPTGQTNTTPTQQPGDPCHLQMARVLPIDGEEWARGFQAGLPPTTDDCSITIDGRRLDSKEAVLAFFAELEAERRAGEEPPAD